jgi:hypothetical protein
MYSQSCFRIFSYCFSLLFLFCLITGQNELSAAGKGDELQGLEYQIERSVAHQGFDKKMCWVHARAGAIPPNVKGNPNPHPAIVLTMQKLLLSGSDIFYALNEMRSDDMASSWSGPNRQLTLARRSKKDGIEVAISDFTPQWHAKTGKLLGIGHTVEYKNNRVMHIRSRYTSYSVYDALKRKWTEWKTMKMPNEEKFLNAGAGSVQRVDLPNGEILLPIYFKAPKEKRSSSTVVRCKFDGTNLEYIEHGNEMIVKDPRGLGEPSIAKFQNKYYLTLRNDVRGYITSSKDGLHFDKPQPWAFDDGSELGSYNTQQHWITHSDALYLVYTRRGANNDHVFRNRAPLFIAKVDPEKLRVIRSTERILVHERGARLGNFGICDVNKNETWVICAEWMQPKGVEKRGSDNSIHIVKLKWSKPNRIFN